MINTQGPGQGRWIQFRIALSIGDSDKSLLLQRSNITMTLWQNLCTYGLALLQTVGLTSHGPLSDQSLSPQTQANINTNLPSIHHAHDIDFGTGAQEGKKRPPPPQPLPWEKRFLPIQPSDLNYKTNNECNYPSDRKRWCYKQSINTDYEEVALVPKTGVTRNVSPRYLY